jgi:uncharacterized protein (UPF0128 family)
VPQESGGNRRTEEAFDRETACPRMLRTIDAVVDGSLRLLEHVELRAGQRALVTLLREDDAAETALLSEPALTIDWDREDEDEAWVHLQ